MRLHHHPLSPYSRKAYAAILHRGDNVDFTVPSAQPIAVAISSSGNPP